MDNSHKKILDEVIDLFEWACIDLPNGDYTFLIPDEALLTSLKNDKRDRSKRDIFRTNLLSLILEPMLTDIHNSDIKFICKDNKCNYYSLKNKFYSLDELLHIKQIKEFETKKITNRNKLFFSILEERDKKKSAIKTIASILKYSEEVKNEELNITVKSLLSNDVLTSLFILLFQNIKNKFTYLYEDEYNEWFQTKPKIKGEEALHIYKEAMRSIPPNPNLKKLQSDIIKKNMKPVIYESIKDFYSKCGELLYTRRANVANKDINKLLAEAELRVSAVLLYDNSNDEFPSGLTNLYKKTNLNNALNCKLSDDSEDLSTAFYYSVPYFILKSNALMYLPVVENEKELNRDNDNINEDIVSLLTENKNIININRFINL
jgi:hypothetical protein